MSEPLPFGLSAQTLFKIKSVFERYPLIENAIIYGSRAKGNYKPGSDIDLVLMGNGLTTDLLLKIENELDDLLLPQKIDLSLMRDIENQDLLDHIKRVGKVFYSVTAKN